MGGVFLKRRSKLKMMRFPVSFSFSPLAAAVVVLCAVPRTQAQAQTPTQPQAQVQSPGDQAPANGTYVVVDPLAGVKYDERFDVSLGAAYGHIKAGPPPLHEGANLGGLDLSGSYWLTHHLGVEGTGRAYFGTSGAGVNQYNVDGPFVSEYIFAAGPEWLGPHNKHGAFLAHAMVGGAYGKFDQDLRGAPLDKIDFFPDQLALAAVIGGHIELNRSARWVFRITPDAKYTRYDINYGNQATYGYWNFALSVGMEYKFKKKR